MGVAPAPGPWMPMRGPRNVWIAAWLGVLLVGATVSANALGALGGTLAPGRSHYVQVVGSDDSGVLAGLVTQTSQGPLGLRETTVAAEDGWVIAHPVNATVDAGFEVVDERTFTDPNGATWTVYTLADGATTAWAVQLGPVHHDASLDGKYNFVLAVDWDEVPEGENLETTFDRDFELPGAA